MAGKGAVSISQEGGVGWVGEWVGRWVGVGWRVSVGVALGKVFFGKSKTRTPANHDNRKYVRQEQT